MKKLKRCEVCGFPLVDKHHLIPQAYYGDTNIIVYLCPNCHRLFHLMYNHYIDGSKGTKLGQIILDIGIGNERTQKLLALVRRSQEVELEVSKRIGEYLNDTYDR